METYENNTNLQTIDYNTDVTPVDANYASCGSSSGVKTGAMAIGFTLLGVGIKWGIDKFSAWRKAKKAEKATVKVVAPAEKRSEEVKEEVKETKE